MQEQNLIGLVECSLDVPQDDVSGEELDLIQAIFPDLARQVLSEADAVEE